MEVNERVPANRTKISMEVVFTCEYLGSVILNYGKIEAKLSNRVTNSGETYNAINNSISRKKVIDMNIKMKVHK